MNGGQIAGLVVFGVGALVGVICFLYSRQQREFWQRALQAEAMVVGHQQRRYRETRGASETASTRITHRRHPVFAFHAADGREVHAISGEGARGHPDYFSGQQVRVSYDPQKPDWVSTRTSAEVPLFRVLTGVGVGVALLGVLIMGVAGG